MANENPPPPPTMVEVFMQIERNRQDQTELLRVLMQNTTPRGGDGAERHDDYSDFLSTQPPIFKRAKDPLDADHWLRTIEQKLALIRCEEHEKVLYAAHQLQDAAGAWWQGHFDMQPARHRFTWAEFRTAFRAFHIPKGVMDIKRQEFHNLKQGNKPVLDYVHEFNYLAQYAPEDVSTDEKKRDRFMDGLSEEMQDKLATLDFSDFNHLVNKAIIAEDKMNKLEAKRRKRVAPPVIGASSQRPHVGVSPPPRASASGYHSPQWWCVALLLQDSPKGPSEYKEVRWEVDS